MPAHDALRWRRTALAAVQMAARHGRYRDPFSRRTLRVYCTVIADAMERRRAILCAYLATRAGRA